MLNNVEETQEVSINQMEYCVQYVDSYFVFAKTTPATFWIIPSSAFAECNFLL